MAKVSFTKLGLKSNKDIKTIIWNDQEIEIKQYLPIDEKLSLIGTIINNSAEDAKFYNVGKIEIFTALNIIYEYTNINFTDKQKEDVCKLYDLLVSSGLYEIIVSNIPVSELDWIHEVVWDSIDSIYKYQDSILGILDAVSQDYNNLSLDAATLQKDIANPETLALLKGIMTRLG
jgi:hypothetical protein